MTLTNQLWGATRSQLGASYLLSKAKLRVQEGYKIGASTHYVDLGEYEVSDFSNRGPFDQKIDIGADSQVARLNKNNDVVTRNFDNQYIYYSDFNDPDEIKKIWTPDDASDWSIASGMLSCEVDGLDVLVFNGNQELEDFILVLKARSNKIDTGNGALISIIFRVNPDTYNSLGDFHGYELWIRGGSSNVVELIEWNGTSQTTLQSETFAPSNNTWYWFMLTVKGDEVRLAADDGEVNITLKLYSKLNYRHPSGLVGLGHRWSAQAGDKTDFDFFDLIEIKDQYKVEDVIEQTLGMGGVFKSNIQSEFDPAEIHSGFNQTVGSCFVTGVTDGFDQVDLYDTGSGVSANMFYTAGSTFNNFVFECEVKGRVGLSNSWPGIYVGTSVGDVKVYSFGTRYMAYGASNSNPHLFDYWHASGVVGFQNRSNHTKFVSDEWYKLKLVKTNNLYRYYINDGYIGSMYGNTSEFTDHTDVFVGVGNRTGAGVAVTSFRNLRISKLDDLVEDATIEQNTPFSSAYNRYLPEGFISTWRTDTVDIFEIGASRGTHGVSQYIMGSDESLNNVSGYKLATTKGVDTFSDEASTKPRVVNQLSDSRSIYIQDKNIQSQTDAQNVALSTLRELNENVETTTAEIRPRVDMERYDTVESVDTKLGVSKQMLVKSFTKRFSSSGEFRQTLRLVDKT